MMVYRREPLISFTINLKEFVMKNYQKLFIGTIVIGLLATCAVPANAAMPKKAVVKVAGTAKDFITKTSTSLGNAIWNNKGSIAVGSAAVALATNPAPFVSGATTMITGRPSDPSATGIQSYLVGWLFYAVATILAILGVRYAWAYLKDWKNWVPLLLIVGVCCITCGTVEAGIIHFPTVEGLVDTIPKPPVLPTVPWWSLFNVVLLVITIFM
jgi:hypothetical protein